MMIRDERYDAFLKEVYDHKEWYNENEFGNIVFNETAPKNVVEKYNKLNELLSCMSCGIIEIDEFEEKWEELLK
ncbi:MAG: hypothetical protein IKJ30_01185 [Bacilli bacterium]|nr:hypothetical protein [Bacilli bacterium]